FWLLIKPKYSLISLLALVLSGYSLYHFFAFNFSGKFEKKPETSLTVFSYNVKVFDLYNWSKNKETSRKILQTIIDADADVVCLQEFYSDNTEAFNMLKKLEVIYPFSHVEVTYSTKG